jgi:SecD/SecF fusion protein
LFTSLFVTRTIFNIMIDTFNVKTLSSFPLTFPKWDRALKPDIHWMKMAPIFWVISGVFIIAGSVAFVAEAYKHELADVDFASGTQVQFDLRNSMGLEEVRRAFDTVPDKDKVLPALNLTAVGEEGRPPNSSYELVTANPDSKQVRSAVLSVLGPKLITDLPSKFDHVTDSVDIALSAGVVQNITPGFTVKDFGDFKPAEADDFIGGAAVLLKDLNPPLKPDQIRDRIDRQRATQGNLPGLDPNSPVLSQYTVVSPLGPGVPTSSAVILTSDPAYQFDKDPGKWQSNVAGPIWDLVTHGINHEGTLQKVNTFGPQIAGDNQQAAFFALILSAVVIMAYIWLRFGNLKYGTATVLAMLHDVALVIGAVGLSHYIVKIPWLANILMVEAFRVNLTIVAAVLTVMSYSMIDTIVVFDRIRENRGKYGYLSKKIIDDSINQTLSRTLLTAGTNIVTVAGMYFVGGPGIHGFTFVLLVGILVGTYSSIAIAAPFLLLGADVKEDAGPKNPPTRALAAV